MFVFAAALPIKIAFDTVSGTMANAGSNQPMMMGPMVSCPPPNKIHRTVHTMQPQSQTKNNIKPASVVKFHNQDIYLGPDPIFITCPSCFALITTKVVYETGETKRTFTCCSNSMKDALHYCPTCHAYLGKFIP